MRSTTTAGLMAVLALAGCKDVRSEFPAGIELGEEIAASRSFTGDCSSAEYRLSDETLDAIDAGATGFFYRLGETGGISEAYGPWTETPLRPEQQRPWGAFGGCGDDRDIGRAKDLDAVLQSSDSYYTFSKDGTTMLLIVPGMKLAAYFHVGRG